MKTETYKKILNEHGCKATPAMLNVLHVLSTIKEPISVEKIQHKLGAKADTSTLYRILERFEKNGLVRSILSIHAHVHYELNKDDHHHISCVSCGRSEDVALCPLDKRSYKPPSSSLFSHITGHSFELFGVCKSCDKK